VTSQFGDNLTRSLGDKLTIHQTTSIQSASCLINAQQLPAHCPAADNYFTGYTRRRPDRWLVATQCHSPFR